MEFTPKIEQINSQEDQEAVAYEKAMEELKKLIQEEHKKAKKGEPFNPHFEHIEFNNLTYEEKDLFYKFFNDKLSKEELDEYWEKAEQMPEKESQFDKEGLPTDAGRNLAGFIGNQLNDQRLKEYLSEKESNKKI